MRLHVVKGRAKRGTTAAIRELASAPGARLRLVETASVVPALRAAHGAYYTEVALPGSAYGLATDTACSSVPNLLVVAEAIPRAHLGTAQQAQIDKMRRRKDFTGYFKPLLVDVRADTLQRVGVRLRRDHLDTGSLRDNAYWEPVVWEEVPRECR